MHLSIETAFVLYVSQTLDRAMDQFIFTASVPPWRRIELLQRPLSVSIIAFDGNVVWNRSRDYFIILTEILREFTAFVVLWRYFKSCLSLLEFIMNSIYF